MTSVYALRSLDGKRLVPCVLRRDLGVGRDSLFDPPLFTEC